MNIVLKLISFSLALMLFVNVLANPNSTKSEPTLSWEVLQAHEIPEWFKDAKFGIYDYLGVSCVPKYDSEWYPRYMYTEGHKVQKHHEENFSSLEEFGYHDFIPMFKLENFDAKEWEALYKRAGAKFAGPEIKAYKMI